MNYEPATEKQVNFMKSLKIEVPESITKMEARLAIDRVLNKQEIDEKPEVVRPGYPKRHEEVKNRNNGKTMVNGKPATTMYASYAKDIFVAMYDKEVGLKEAMQIAVELVKQAKEAFE